MEKMYTQLSKQMKGIIEQLQQQSEQLAALKEIIARKDAQIAALTARIEKLTLRKNSGKDSKTPSSKRLNLRSEQLPCMNYNNRIVSCQLVANPLPKCYN